MGKLPFEKIERKILVRKDAETNSDLGCAPEKRKTEEIINYGIVNIDKPKGPTSHQVADYVQKILSISKSGHSGTLDPAVTGVLPVALGRGTRIVQALLTAGKEYIAIMHLHKEVDEKTFRELLLIRGKTIGKKNLTEQYLKEKTKLSVDEFIKEFFSFKKNLKDVPGLKLYFRLKPPVKGFERKGIKVPYSMGGALGYRKDNINNLIIRML